MSSISQVHSFYHPPSKSNSHKFKFDNHLTITNIWILNEKYDWILKSLNLRIIDQRVRKIQRGWYFIPHNTNLSIPHLPHDWHGSRWPRNGYSWEVLKDSTHSGMGGSMPILQFKRRSKMMHRRERKRDWEREAHINVWLWCVYICVRLCVAIF